MWKSACFTITPAKQDRADHYNAVINGHLPDALIYGEVCSFFRFLALETQCFPGRTLASQFGQTLLPRSHSLAKAAKLWVKAHWTSLDVYMVGPPGFEPGTKGL
jgi:hypothetical protein